LPLYFERPEAYRAEDEIFSELGRRRGAIMGSFLTHVGEVADALPSFLTIRGRTDCKQVNIIWCPSWPCRMLEIRKKNPASIKTWKQIIQSFFFTLCFKGSTRNVLGSHRLWSGYLKACFQQLDFPPWFQWVR
jgi:hypothetical protein